MSNTHSTKTKEPPVKVVRVFYNPEEGADWWCEDDDDFMAVADTPSLLMELIREWQASEGIDDVQLAPMGQALDVVAEEVLVGFAADY